MLCIRRYFSDTQSLENGNTAGFRNVVYVQEVIIRMKDTV